MRPLSGFFTDYVIGLQSTAITIQVAKYVGSIIVNKTIVNVIYMYIFELLKFKYLLTHIQMRTSCGL